MFNVPSDLGFRMFRVKQQDDSPGFHVVDDGSTHVSAPPQPDAPSVNYGFYGNTRRNSDLATIFGLPPDSPAIDQWRQGDQPESYAPPQQLAAGQSCASAHRACVLSGRPDLECLKAFHNCSSFGNGLPTIFAPGIWGRPK